MNKLDLIKLINTHSAKPGEYKATNNEVGKPPNSLQEKISKLKSSIGGIENTDLAIPNRQKSLPENQSIALNRRTTASEKSNFNELAGKGLESKIEKLESQNQDGSQIAAIAELKTQQTTVDHMSSFWNSQEAFWADQAQANYDVEDMEQVGALYAEVNQLSKDYAKAVKGKSEEDPSVILAELEAAQKELYELAGDPEGFEELPEISNLQAGIESVYAEFKVDIAEQQGNTTAEEFWKTESEFWNTIESFGYPEDTEKATELTKQITSLENQADALLQDGSPEAMKEYEAIQGQLEESKVALLELY